MLRDFKPEDYEQVKALHEAGGDNYTLPDLNSPLFISAKVLELNGKIRLFMGARVQVEAYLLMDNDWYINPSEKMACIQVVDQEVRKEVWNKGVEEVVCYVPPTKKRFVERVKKWLGYQSPRSGWTPLSRPTKETQ